MRRRRSRNAALGATLAVASLLGAPRVAEAQPNDRAARGAQEVPHVEAAQPLLEQNEELNLSVGENKTVPATNVKSYSEGVRGVADVRLTPDSTQFVVVGQKAGSTTLLLIRKDGTQVNYTINVYQRPMQSVERELLQLLDGTTGVRVRRVGARFFIEGGVSTEPELKRIEQIGKLFPGQVESLVVLGGAAAERKLNVRIDFLFVQFDRNKGYQVGVTWPTRIGGPGVAQFDAAHNFYAAAGEAATSAQAQIVGQALPGLDIAASNGWAKVLKHSTVITSNGSEATFSSGGEQNYLISTGLATNLAQITFGTNVTVLPRFDPSTRELEIRLDAEVADLTPTVAPGTNLPGRNVSKLTTLVALKLGQSIVLSGIRSRTQRHSVNGVPLLSEIPLLGLLFGSHSDTRDEVEGVIFVVPSIVESVPKSTQEIIDRALEDYGAYSGDLDRTRVWQKNIGSSEGAAPAAAPPPP